MWKICISTLILAQIISCVRGMCTSEQHNAIISCMQGLQTFMTAQSPAEQAGACRESRRALNCLIRGMQDCPELNTGQLSQSIQFIANPLKSMCGEEAVMATEPPQPEVTMPDEPTVEVPDEPTVLEPEQPEDLDNIENNTVDVGNGDNGGRCRKKDKKNMRRCASKLKLYAKESPMRCRKVSRALDCISRLMANCESALSSKKLARINNLQTKVMEICVKDDQPEPENIIQPEAEVPAAGSDNVVPSCPDDYANQMQRCVNSLNSQMATYMKTSQLAQGCSVINDALSCVNDIIANCPGQPGIAMVATNMNGTLISEMIAGVCSGQPPVPNAPEPVPEVSTSGCDNIKKKLQKCKGHVEFFETSKRPIQERCRYLNKGFNCYERLVAACPTDPDVVKFTSKVDIANARAVINAHYCKGSG